ncbi:hypothetical protein PMIN06_002161 [Paraphaeosphaeria minitans]
MLSICVCATLNGPHGAFVPVPGFSPIGVETVAKCCKNLEENVCERSVVTAPRKHRKEDRECDLKSLFAMSNSLSNGECQKVPIPPRQVTHKRNIENQAYLGTVPSALSGINTKAAADSLKGLSKELYTV